MYKYNQKTTKFSYLTPKVDQTDSLLEVESVQMTNGEEFGMYLLWLKSMVYSEYDDIHTV